MKNENLKNLIEIIESIPVVNTDTIDVKYNKLRLIHDEIADMLRKIRANFETWKKSKVMTIIQYHLSA